jgi:acetate kinase
VAAQVFVHRVRKYLGAYLLNLELDVAAVVFSGGIGEHSAPIRSAVCSDLQRFGIALDEGANAAGTIGAPQSISEAGQAVDVLVVPTDEELCIAQDTVRLAGVDA